MFLILFQICQPFSATSSNPPNKIPNVLTTFSFAISPVIVATAPCHVPQPSGAKIIAIADSLDAMLTNRSYRRKLSFEQAKEEIAKNAGIMYDNKMVQVILNNWNVVENYYSCDFVKNHV